MGKEIIKSILTNPLYTFMPERVQVAPCLIQQETTCVRSLVRGG
jgi:hypothetical protein